MKIKSIKLRKWSLIWTLLFCSGYAIYKYSDKYVAGVVERSRPDLEKRFSAQLGREIAIGSYKGLRPWGIALGPSLVDEGSLDSSRASFEGLRVQFAPISSLLNRRPVLVLSANNARIHLNANKSGSYFSFENKTSINPPNFNLIIRTDSTSSVFIDTPSKKILVEANVAIGLPEKKISGFASLEFPDKGSLRIRGTSLLTSLQFKGRARFNDFSLDNLQSPFLDKFNILAKGKLDSNIYVGANSSNIFCRGKLSLENLKLRPLLSNRASLLSKGSSIICRNNIIQIPDANFEYGPWNAQVNGYLPIGKKSNYILNLTSLIRTNDQPVAPLTVKSTLPVLIDKKGYRVGDLFADVSLKNFAMSSLTPIIGTNLSGNISSIGTIQGPLSALTSSLSIEIENPQISAIRLQEKWQGNFLGKDGEGGLLKMSSIGAAVPADLKAQFKEDWSLRDLTLNRLGGFFSLSGVKDGYAWNANNFRLDRLEVATPPDGSFKRTFGKLAGGGLIKTDPFFIDGKLSYLFPRLLGVSLRQANLKGSYKNKNYSFIGEVIPPDGGTISIDADGQIGGRIRAKILAEEISPSWLADSGLKISQLNLGVQDASGSANDLDDLSLVSLSDSLDNQLVNWDISRVFVERYKRMIASKKVFNPSDLEGKLDAEANLEGSSLSNLKLDIKASGKVWTKGDTTNPVDIKPFTAKFKSISLKENGQFTFIDLPFSLLSLFFSTPTSLTGMFGFTGRYNYKKNSPEIEAQLILREARIADKEFILEKGNLYISNTILNADIAIRDVMATESIQLSGTVPLSENLPLNVQLASHGDGLWFLDGLSNNLSWESGHVDLRLLIRGTYREPLANGYLVIDDAKFLFDTTIVENFDAKVIFDFDRVEIQELNALVDSSGTFKAKGEISTLAISEDLNKELNLEVNSMEIKNGNSSFNLSSNLKVKGSLLSPMLGGEVTISEGSISTRRSRHKKRTFQSNRKSTTFVTNQGLPTVLPEQRWDYKSPLMLFIQDNNSTASRIFKSSFPRGLSFISFDSLKLNLGPNLLITSQPFARFNAYGTLFLDGPLDQNLALKGVVRLKNGRVNLFTTSFNLDRSEPNIALFAPSMGLIPFLDITMTSRVPDVIQSDPSQLDSSNELALNGSGAVGIGGSRFVKVELIATGPADRVAESFELRSTPALPQGQLLNLIGGNSLTMLMSGSQREVLVDFLNRSFLSPILGNVSDAFSERLQLALYPAFVASADIEKNKNEESNKNELVSTEASSEDLSPQQAWIAELGLEVSDRVNFSVQTTPTRDDIPPQGSILYQLNSSFGVLGSLDTNGNWNSQIQLFIRY